MTGEESSEGMIRVDELECEGDAECEVMPTKVYTEGHAPTFVCDDHAEIFPEDSLEAIENG